MEPNTPPQRNWVRMTQIVSIVVIIVITISFVVYAFLPRPPSPTNLTFPYSTTHQVLAGNSTDPGFYSLQVPGLKEGDNFKAQVAVTGALSE